MIWIWILAPAVACVALLALRWPYRWFLAAIALWGLQTANLAFGTPTREWAMGHWLPMQVLLVILTAGATQEVIERTRQAVTPLYRLQLRVAS